MKEGRREEHKNIITQNTLENSRKQRLKAAYIATINIPFFLLQCPCKLNLDSDSTNFDSDLTKLSDGCWPAGGRAATAWSLARLASRMSLRELFETTLHSEDERLIARCHIPAIVQAIEDYGVYSVDALRSTLDVSLTALQLALGGSAPPSFLPLVKKQLESGQPQPATPRGGAFSTPSSQQSSFSAAGFTRAEQVPLVVTVKFNGRVIAERTTVFVEPRSTFEQVAGARLQAVLGSEEALQFAQCPLKVSVFRTADQLPSDRSAAAISDPVGGAFALGYAHVLMGFTAPVYSCARRPSVGANPFVRMMDGAVKDAAQGAQLSLPKPYVPKQEGGTLNFELALYNALLAQCDTQLLGVAASAIERCETLLKSVRDAVWLVIRCG